MKKAKACCLNDKTLQDNIGLQVFVIIATLDTHAPQVLLSPLFKDFDCNVDKLHKADRTEYKYIISEIIHDYLDKDYEKFQKMYKLCWKILKKLIDKDELFLPVDVDVMRTMPYKRRSKKNTTFTKPKLKPEEEFWYYSQYHKINTIQLARELYNSRTLFTTRFQKEFKKFENEKFFKVSCYYRDMLRNNPSELNSLYEYCWKKVRNYTNENEVYTSELTKNLKKDYRL